MSLLHIKHALSLLSNLLSFLILNFEIQPKNPISEAREMLQVVEHMTSIYKDLSFILSIALCLLRHNGHCWAEQNSITRPYISTSDSHCLACSL